MSGTGWTATCSNPSEYTNRRIKVGASQAVICTYTFTANGTYSFSAGARVSGTATDIIKTVTIRVGTVTATWNHGVVVIGRPSTLTVVNNSAATIAAVELTNGYTTGMTVTSAQATCSPATPCLALQSADGTTAVFNGSLAPGASAAIAITYSPASVPTTSSTGFTVRMTPSEGIPYAYSVSIPSVPLVVPLPDVYGLGILDSDIG